MTVRKSAFISRVAVWAAATYSGVSRAGIAQEKVYGSIP